MGQVPGSRTLLVGDGRLARHLSHYFRSVGLGFERWSRSPAVPHLPEEIVSAADRVLVAINDDAIQAFIDRNRQEPGATWVHFSGSVVVDGAWSVHPLSTFGPELLPVEAYRNIAFIIDADGPSLDQLIPGLTNPSFGVPRFDRALYHALCVAAGNFTTILWQSFLQEIDTRWGIPPTAALPYLEQTAGNLASPTRDGALTGPLARGDSGTIARNVEALDRAGLDELAAVYRVFADRRAARSGAAA